MIDKQLLKTSEVMDIIGVSRSKLWQMECNGLIPSGYRMGKTVRWKAADIYQWMHLGCPNIHHFNDLKSINGADTPVDRLLKVKDICKITGFGRTTVWTMRSNGRLPRCMDLGRSIRWRLSDILQWMDWGFPTLLDFDRLQKNKKVNTHKINYIHITNSKGAKNGNI